MEVPYNDNAHATSCKSIHNNTTKIILIILSLQKTQIYFKRDEMMVILEKKRTETHHSGNYDQKRRSGEAVVPVTGDVQSFCQVSDLKGGSDGLNKDELECLPVIIQELLLSRHQRQKIVDHIVILMLLNITKVRIMLSQLSRIYIFRVEIVMEWKGDSSCSVHISKHESYTSNYFRTPELWQGRLPPDERRTHTGGIPLLFLLSIIS